MASFCPARAEGNAGNAFPEGRWDSEEAGFDPRLWSSGNHLRTYGCDPVEAPTPWRPRPLGGPFPTLPALPRLSSQLLTQLMKKGGQVGQPPPLHLPDHRSGLRKATQAGPESRAHTPLGRREAGMCGMRSLLRMPNRQRLGFVLFSSHLVV